MNIFKALEAQLNDVNTQELVIGMPEEESCYNFTPSGCDLIDTLATTTTSVNCLIITRNIFGRIVETYEFTADVCSEVLNAYYNGINYYLNNRGDWISEDEVNFKKLNRRVI